MSLNVPDALLEQAERGEIDDAAFVACVRTSLPYAWETITRAIGNLETSGDDFADDNTSPPDEQARGQLLRALASDSIRGALERHFGVRLAFQNCCRVGAFTPRGRATTATGASRRRAPRSSTRPRSCATAEPGAAPPCASVPHRRPARTGGQAGDSAWRRARVRSVTTAVWDTAQQRRQCDPGRRSSSRTGPPWPPPAAGRRRPSPTGGRRPPSRGSAGSG